MKKIITLILLLVAFGIKAQEESFPYEVSLNPLSIPNLPGLHSYAFGQHDGKWIFIGGRIDGLHARQANASFPASQNNRQIFVVDINKSLVYTSSIENLPTDLKEQLQSTNMNFFQDGEKLYFIGGYAFASSKGNHITFPFITVIDLASLTEAVILEKDISESFYQVHDERFAVTGGQLGKLGDTFLLVGGHRFDGRYNPMGNPTFVQSYTNQIKRFKIQTSTGNAFQIFDYQEDADQVHLHRRDFNLVPQVFPSGELGYMISSGVFQLNADLPFLYPVDISLDGYKPRTGFNQYLSHYHGAKVALFDEENNQNHSLFFGGLSQYYYQNGSLIKDDLVPFVRTISRVTRFSDDTFQEFVLPKEMPKLQGTSAEFIPNLSLPMFPNKVIKLQDIEAEEFTIGHIFGGISSPSLNPFSVNQTLTTQADPTIFEVKLRKSTITSINPIEGSNPFEISVYPNPFINRLTLKFYTEEPSDISYFVTNSKGQLLINEKIISNPGLNEIPIFLEGQQSDLFIVSVSFNDIFYDSKKVIKVLK
ncbi:T9SS type A sorting domain-containing protein [Mongoliitalea daihaiensis]|uniref:hypothetical protein n=1 Tax=Mongoliitalea daihaiensis TaxID=2782006 RepID=UPI001F3818A9|nr:hypothetical protein [Mongoliitalea daihaiensis]UJP63748.1 hypothetical protein IPZ59_13020 [Mongoliitalea daihaiensis]